MGKEVRVEVLVGKQPWQRNTEQISYADECNDEDGPGYFTLDLEPKMRLKRGESGIMRNEHWKVSSLVLWRHAPGYKLVIKSRFGTKPRNGLVQVLALSLQLQFLLVCNGAVAPQMSGRG